MTWTIPSGVGRAVTKVAAAGVLFASPVAALGGPAFAATGFADTPNVLPAAPPADPPPAPAPPAPPGHGEYYNPQDYNDWYNMGSDGGGGGGGGGG
ncbi:hypothetical protein GCM10009641_62080 [Mycobacterium cookii]|uniref:Uncharacterized protein n=1 Tax=Mycobacterium cookii TaxID=1775 RepID=A0A7I7KWX6_9MYCO|nr:hypothetical protein [Mycobacterium cookii]MCV7331836.1 hypothetical protein [Mycobacterium cookii]BBX46061.1 hypothetical protein MCOO_20760 [Mycobacterium cookii]